MLKLVFSCFVMLLLSAPAIRPAAGLKKSDISYPTAPRVNQIDNYHGVQVKDPFRCLEDPDAKETRVWIEQENKITRQYLDAIKAREGIEKRLTELWDYQKCRIPFQRKGRLFIFRNSGLQNQDVLYVRDRGESEERVLLDPNKLSEDGTVALSGLDVSFDGKLLAYGISKSGSDWQEWFVRDIDTGKDLSDHLKWIKFSGASWSKDGKGFFYSRYDEPPAGKKLQSRNYFQKLYYHRLGENQSKDTLVYERKDEKEWGFDGSVTDDGKYLVIHVWKGTEPKNRIFYKEIGKDGSKVVELLGRADAKYIFVENFGTTFIFKTDLKAPRGRVISLDISEFDQAKGNFKELIAESRDTLEHVSSVGGHLFANYLKDAYTRVIEFDQTGLKLEEVMLPGIGTATGFGGEKRDSETYFSYTSFNTPPVIYKYDIESARRSLFFKPQVKFEPYDYLTRQVFVKSKDGTNVPLFITYKKGLQLNSSNPTYLYGYGGFNISLRPRFSVKMLTWMEMGGVYAQACLRGGGEYGEQWHQAGTKLSKQNVFDDFIACAEWLIDNKYTSSKKLAIAGGSNGGLLVGACMTQRPDLFAAACPAVGVMDMLRFHKYTIGWGWKSDYGSSDDKEQFKALYAYSPLHNLKPGVTYPATLITTADHDDRVVPAHSFKFAATLQEAQAGDAPVLIRIETKAGHGRGKPTKKIIEETSDKLAFLTRVLDFEKQAEGALGEEQ